MTCPKPHRSRDTELRLELKSLDFRSRLLPRQNDSHILVFWMVDDGQAIMKGKVWEEESSLVLEVCKVS